jgi:hypothetical protein
MPIPHVRDVEALNADHLVICKSHHQTRLANLGLSNT